MGRWSCGTCRRWLVGGGGGGGSGHLPGLLMGDWGFLEVWVGGHGGHVSGCGIAPEHFCGWADACSRGIPNTPWGCLRIFGAVAAVGPRGGLSLFLSLSLSLSLSRSFLCLRPCGPLHSPRRTGGGGGQWHPKSDQRMPCPSRGAWEGGGGCRDTGPTGAAAMQRQMGIWTSSRVLCALPCAGEWPFC